MERLRVHNLSQDYTLGENVRRAVRFHERLMGLTFRSGLEPGEGLWLEPCRSIHTHFMRFPIDVLFLDGEGLVLHLIRAMPPWRISPVVPGAVVVLELAAGAAGPTNPGDRVVGHL